MFLPQTIAPLRVASYRRLWFGQFLSAVGDGIYPVAVAMLVLQGRGSKTDLGFVLGAEALAFVIAVLFGGILADRFLRTRLMIVADVLRGAAVVGLGSLPSHPSLASLIGLSALVGLGTALFRPAYGALTPVLLPPADVQAATALNSITGRIAAIAGPTLGGVLTLISVHVAFFTDAATFAVSLVSLAGISEATVSKNQHESLLRQGLAGIRAVADRPWIAAVIIQGTVQLLLVIAPTIVLLPLVLNSRGQTTAYGMMLAFQAVGSIAGGLIAGRWRPHEPGTAALVGIVAMSGELACLAYKAPLPLLGISMIGTGFGYALFGVLWMSALQREVPKHLLARVISLDYLGTAALAPAGLALTAPAVSAFGLARVVSIAGIFLLVTTAIPLFVPGVRQFRDPRAVTSATQDTIETRAG